MFTDWEVIPLTARLRLPGLVLTLAAVAVSPLAGQKIRAQVGPSCFIDPQGERLRA